MQWHNSKFLLLFWFQCPWFSLKNINLMNFNIVAYRPTGGQGLRSKQWDGTVNMPLQQQLLLGKHGPATMVMHTMGKMGCCQCSPQWGVTKKRTRATSSTELCYGGFHQSKPNRQSLYIVTTPFILAIYKSIYFLFFVKIISLFLVFTKKFNLKKLRWNCVNVR
jgi:hypothetical protein